MYFNRKYAISTTGSMIGNYALVYNNDLQYNITLNCRRNVEGEINNDLLTGNNQAVFNWLNLEIVETC